MPDQAPQNPIVVRNRSASGGVNTFSSPLDIEADQVVQMDNGYAPVPGIRKNRPGSSLIATGITFGPILAMCEFTPSNFNSQLLVVSPGATFPNSGHLQLWKWDGTTPTFTNIGTLTGMTSATLPVDIITGVDINIGQTPYVARIVSQANIAFDYVYAGAALSAATGPNSKPYTGAWPIGIALDRAFFGGRTATARGHLAFSDLGSFNYTGWSPTTQSLTFGGGTKQEFVRLKSFRQGELMVFMSDRIESLILDGDPFGVTPANAAWSRVVIDTTIGCGARNTVATVGQDLFFMDQYGNIRSLARTISDNSQGTKTKPISAPIQSWIDRINPSAIQTACAVSFDRYYIVSLPIDSAVTPSHSWVFDTINQAWFGPWTGTWANVGQMTVATLSAATSSSDRNPTPYLGSTSTGPGLVYRAMSGTSDDGAPITYQETTRRETFAAQSPSGVVGGLEARKKPLRVRVYTLPSPGATLMIEASKDGGAFSLVGYADLSGSSPQLPQAGPIDLTGAGIVEKVLNLEGPYQNLLDLRYRFTCTASSDIQILGYSTQAHLKNIDWTPN